MPSIHTIDLHYLGEPALIACYVVIGPDGAVLVETGPSSCMEALDRGLRSHGLSLDDIQHALVTHIHLDHAGAAGCLARRGTKIYVHEFGAQHLVDPDKLIASATRIYGDEMQRLWGEILPAPADNIVAIGDRRRLQIAGLHFTAIETPGHARHHHAYALETDSGPVCFTGDVAGMIIPALACERVEGMPRVPVHHRFINLPTPPPEFEPDMWIQSLDRLERARFKTLYLTHFGAVSTPLAHFTAVKQAVRRHTEYISAKLNIGMREDEITLAYAKWVRMQAERAGASADQLQSFVSDNLLRMNVMGIARYLKSAPSS